MAAERDDIAGEGYRVPASERVAAEGHIGTPYGTQRVDADLSNVVDINVAAGLSTEKSSALPNVTAPAEDGTNAAVNSANRLAKVSPAHRLRDFAVSILCLHPMWMLLITSLALEDHRKADFSQYQRLRFRVIGSLRISGVASWSRKRFDSLRCVISNAACVPLP